MDNEREIKIIDNKEYARYLDTNYWVSKDGDVWTNIFNKNIYQSASGGRKLYATVKIAGHTKGVHRMVLESWVGPCPDGCETDHINGDSLDNRLENLRWLSIKKNRGRPGEEHNMAKLSDNDVVALRGERCAGAKLKDLAKKYDISYVYASQLVNYRLREDAGK